MALGFATTATTMVSTLMVLTTWPFSAGGAPALARLLVRNSKYTTVWLGKLIELHHLELIAVVRNAARDGVRSAVLEEALFRTEDSHEAPLARVELALGKPRSDNHVLLLLTVLSEFAGTTGAIKQAARIGLKERLHPAALEVVHSVVVGIAEGSERTDSNRLQNLL